MKHKVAIIGLGYVGLPLAIASSEKHAVVGFDINGHRIKELQDNFDKTGEVSTTELQTSTLKFSSDEQAIKDANFYIVTVPTPIDTDNNPDLTLLKKATELVGRNLDSENIVVYESTVYPGCTEEDCVPILEKESGLKFNEDFFCGYSPERINPGDKNRRIKDIRKVTSGSTDEIADIVDAFYASFITAGTFKASSIKIAEAAKVIENAQRDINIAFVNELAIIFNKLDIDTREVLEAAGTKWNFLPFRPGLVGGHCIGVDPYYLTHKAESVGYLPQVILSGRRINDSMGKYIAGEVIKLMASRKMVIAKSSVLVLGITFKENCPDIRNSKVLDIINELEKYELEVDVFDPNANADEVKSEYSLEVVKSVKKGYSAYILAVAHDQFNNLDWVALKQSGVVYDVKAFLPSGIADEGL